MAVTVYLINAAASAHRGDNTVKLNAAASWWTPKKLSETRGVDTTGTAVTATVATVLGATPGVEVGVSSIPYEWISEPLSADFTIAGTITLNLWAAESANAANAAINATIDKIAAATGALTRIATSVRVTELGTAAAAANFTVTPTSTACKRGDRLCVRVFADDAGVMAAGQTVTFYFDRSTAAQGESFVTFTETLTFEPAGDPGALDQANSAGTLSMGAAATETASAQGFVAQGALNEVRLTLSKVGAPTDDLVIEVQGNSASAPSGVVVGAVATVSGASLTTTLTLYTYSCNVALTAGLTYWLVIRRTTAVDSVNRYGIRAGGTAPGWPAFQRMNGSGVWSVVGGTFLTMRLAFATSTYYLTDTAESINPGSATEKKALTTRGAGSTNAVTNTAAGPTAGIQTTASAGGTAIEWYTPPLEAVTLGGKGRFNIRALESNAAANASLKAEIAVTANDGTGATVWGVGNVEPSTTAGEVGTADAAMSAWVAGDDTSVSAGQRLRYRIYLEDISTGPLVTGNTVTISYSGTSAAAAGDTYVILPVPVTEQAGAPAATPKPRMLVRPGVAVLRAGTR